MDIGNGRQAMDLLVARLPVEAVASIDPPLMEAGVWHVDVSLGGQKDVVSWYPGRGYAMSSAEETSYGENPDVWEAEPAAAAARFLGILATRGEAASPNA